jgi:hypothetical protein
LQTCLLRRWQSIRAEQIWEQERKEEEERRRKEEEERS